MSTIVEQLEPIDDESVKVTDLTIGVDGGGSEIKIGAVDPTTGELLSRPIVFKPRAKSRNGSFEEDYQAILAAIRLLIRQHVDPDSTATVTVGFGIAGKVLDDREGMYNCPNLGERWNNVRFIPRLRMDLGIRVDLGNDAEAGATGAAMLDPMVKNEQRFGYLIWGTGIGFCLVIRTKEGFLLFYPTESGHQKIAIFAFRKCGCGRRGCVEAYYSGGAIEKRFKLDSARDLPRWKWWLRIFPGMAMYTANMASAFPGTIICAGGVATNQSLVMDAINFAVKLFVKVLKPKEVGATTVEHIGIKGAALLPRVVDTRTDAELAKSTDD